MLNRHEIIRQTATALLAFGLIISLLPDLTAAQYGSGQSPLTGQGLPEMPMKAPPENSLAYEVSEKPAIASRKLSGMESVENWEPWVNF